jgi:carboxypeptidase Q
MSVRLKVAGLCALALLAGWTPAAAQSSMGEQIRREGLANSHAMTLVTQLADGIGPRLMGSPNLRAAYDWAQKTFKDLGAENVHLEDMGEFGLSWRQNNAWLRMSAPDPVVFFAQAAPWSVSSNGPQTGEAVAVELNSDADFAKYEGRLRGKVVLLGPAIDLPPSNEPFNERATKDDVLSGRIAAMQRGYHQRRAAAPPPPARDFGAEKATFLAREGALAVVLPSPQMPTKSGTTGLLVVDKPPFGVKPWTAETRPKFPMLVTTVESFGRAWRLSKAGAPVRMQFDVDAETLGEHEHGFNVVAEIPGSDPKLKSEVVILGAHLDSWAAGQGATDNGTGVAATIEALRILKAVGAKPKRTIRFVLYAGEEQGLLGSQAYVAKHYGSSASGQDLSGRPLRRGDLKTLADYGKVSAEYNLDDGTGKILAVFSGGDPAVAAIYESWLPDLADLGVVKVFNERSFFSDQGPYQSVGIPGISFQQERLDYFTRTHHSQVDTLEHVIPADLAQSATVAAIFLLKTADLPERLPRLALPD